MTDKVLYTAKSKFNGNLTVYDYRGYRFISSQYKSRFGTTQTGVNLTNPLLSKFKMYPHGLTLSLAHVQNPSFYNITMIGVAGGFLVNYLNHYLKENVNLTAIEIDPEMVKIANEYFNCKYPILNEDGHKYIMEYPDLKDQEILIIDAFHGMFIPPVFNNAEFYDKVKSSVLSPYGCLAINIIENDESQSLVDLISSKFKYTYKYYCHGNQIVIASDVDAYCDQNAKDLQTIYRFVYPLDEMSSRFKDNRQPSKVRKSLFPVKESD